MSNTCSASSGVLNVAGIGGHDAPAYLPHDILKNYVVPFYHHQAVYLVIICFSSFSVYILIGTRCSSSIVPTNNSCLFTKCVLETLFICIFFEIF